MNALIARLRELGWRPPAAFAALAVVLCAPWWGPPLLSHLAYFRVRQVEIHGRTYAHASNVVARLRVDTMTSIWTDLDVLERRVASDPQVRSVTIERKLPGTLVVHLTENLPVALVPGARGMRAVDAAGRVLPIDPSRVDIDLPVVSAADTALLRLLSNVRTRAPALFAEISTARRVTRDEVALELPGVLVRAPTAVTARRLADIVPVEQDLTRRRARVAELDLRFRDQVIARLQ